MPTYTGICTYGELYSVLKQSFSAAGWTIDDRTGRDTWYNLGVDANRVWAVDSLYVYGRVYADSYTRGRIIDKGNRSIIATSGIASNMYEYSPINKIEKTDNVCNFTGARTGKATLPASTTPYSFDTSQDTGIYFDDYYFIPTSSSITMYYGGLFCTSPAGVTTGLVKTPRGFLLRPASLIPPYNSTSISDYWPVQYLLKIENTHCIIALQGIYQFDTSARTAIGYTGLIKGDIGNPPGVVAVSTHQHPQQTQRAAVTNTVTDPSLPAYYIAQPATLLTSPNFDFDFMLSTIGLCRNGEGTRGALYDIYACNIQAGTLLTGETITAPDGRKYTFFNVPTSQDGWYNGFHQNNGAWLAIRH